MVTNLQSCDRVQSRPPLSNDRSRPDIGEDTNFRPTISLWVTHAALRPHDERSTHHHLPFCFSSSESRTTLTIVTKPTAQA